MKTKNKLLIIVSLTLLSTILRLPSIGVPLDIDEGIDFHEHAFVSWKTLFFDYWDIKHTFFNALSRLSMKLFGVNEVASRLPALLSGILAIPLLYWVSLLLLNSATIATLSSYLLAFSIPHLRYSHDGRGYTLSVLLALTLVLVILKLTERKNLLWWGSLTCPQLMFHMVC